MRTSKFSVPAAVLILAVLSLVAMISCEVVTIPEQNPDSESFYAGDADGDGYSNELDCDDHVASVYPGATELCDGLDNDCDGELPDDEQDADADGYRVCEADCDDTNASSYPYAPEQCDGQDNDCDGEVAEDEIDGDGDGYATCDGDCDDTETQISPEAEEICEDGKDNDCDELIDGDDPDCAADDDDDVTGDDDDVTGDDDDVTGDDDTTG